MSQMHAAARTLRKLFLAILMFRSEWFYLCVSSFWVSQCVVQQFSAAHDFEWHRAGLLSDNGNIVETRREIGFGDWRQIPFLGYVSWNAHVGFHASIGSCSLPNSGYCLEDSYYNPSHWWHCLKAACKHISAHLTATRLIHAFSVMFYAAVALAPRGNPTYV